MGLILQAVLDIPLWQSIVFVGVITLIYSTSGGMKAVVYGDAIQMVLIFGGLLVVGWYAVGEVGGLSTFWENVDRERLVAVDYSSLGLDGDEFGFLPMLFGGFVLYASYYGCDQTQAQRLMSARDIGDARRLLFANGVLRFPLVLMYCFVGLLVGLVFTSNPELLAAIPDNKPDYMMPVFILEYLPHGVIGLLLVAIMAAAMSSLSSAINSLAAVTLDDLASVGLKPGNRDSEVIWARGVSFMWGLAILVMSAYAGSIAPTVIEAINKVGSALYGPILAVFLVGMLGSRVSGTGASAGLLAGVAVNLYLWKAQPQIFWMWWNFIGLIVTTAVALIVGRTGRSAAADDTLVVTTDAPSLVRSPFTAGLVLIFLAIVVVTTLIAGAGQ
ncbi:MAG: sodium transporter [Pseudomonadota bacterium]